MQDIIKENVSYIDLNDSEEVKKLLKKRNELVKEKKVIKNIAISLWEMQNHEISLVEKDYKISNVIFTEVVYKGEVVGAIQKPMDKVTSEDMNCIIEKRNNVLSYFPYSRIDEIFNKGGNASKTEIKELSKYKNYIKTYKFWKHAEPYFSQAVKTFKMIVDDENCKVFLKENVKLKNYALKDQIPDEYKHFLYENHKISLVSVKDDKSEFVGGNNCYKRDLYLNNLLIRTTYDIRKNIGFEDLTYLFKRYQEEIDAFNISLYNYKKNSLQYNIKKAEESGSLIKTLKLKNELNKLNKKHKELDFNNNFWRRNKFIISDALLSYYQLDKNESQIKQINKKISEIDNQINAFNKVQDESIKEINSLI